jgi:signal transduction histidine kinase
MIQEIYRAKSPLRSHVAILALLIFLLPIQGKAQEADSLRELIQSAEKDSNKVLLLLRYGKALPESQLSDALAAARSAYEISRDLGFSRGVMLATAELGKQHKRAAAYDSALFYYDISIPLADSLNDQRLLAISYNEYGSLLRRKGYYSSALDYHEKSFQISLDLGDSTGMANSNLFAAIIHEYRLDYETAIHYYVEALRIYEAQGKKINIGVALLNMGDLHYEMEEFDKALLQYRRGLKEFLEVNDLRRTGLSYNKIGTIHSAWESYDSALFYYEKCKVFYDSIGNNSGIAHLNINMGNFYKNTGKPDQAMRHYEKAIEAFRNMGFQRGYLNAMMAMADLYKVTGQTSRALDVYFQCERIASDVDPQALLSVYSEIVELYKGIHNAEKALKYQDLYLIMSDSVYQLEKVRVIADAELKYEKEKDKALILKMEKESLKKDVALERGKRQSNSLLYGSLGVVILIVFLFSYFGLRVRKNRIIAEQKIMQLEEEKKLLAARSIVEGQEEERRRIAKELHDGLGVLLSSAKMHFTSIRDKSPEARPMIDKASKLLEQATGDVRRISHNMMPGLLTRYGFYEAVEDLFEQVDDMEGLHAEVKIAGEQSRLKENTEIMLYRIIQEMVNNTLKHAESKKITLDIQISPGEVALDYKDDGKGFDFDEKIKLKSMGLTSLQSRVKFLGGELQYSSSPGKGIHYTFEVPA